MKNSKSTPKDVSYKLMDNLPAPIDDGACDHLGNKSLPNIALITTNGESLDISTLKGWVIIYIYPMTGKPGVAVPDGWVDIPGAAGCTPQSCSFRDHIQQFKALGVSVFGLSAQSDDDQIEAMQRLSLPYPLLSDRNLELYKALCLPMFEVGGLHLYKRVTLVCHNGIIKKYFYPVFPPDENVIQVINWLNENI